MSANVTGYTKLVFLLIACVFYWVTLILIQKKYKVSNKVNTVVALVALFIAASPSYFALQRPLWEKSLALIVCGIIGILYTFGLQSVSKLVGRIIRSGLKDADDKSTLKEGENQREKHKHK